jgi:HAD superfamily hydrolase (TIGR01509 family)
VTPPLPFETALLDVDGTLIDSNDAHAETWAEALRDHGVETDATTIRPLIGMGGDKLLPAVAMLEEDSVKGRAIADRKKALFRARLPELHPTPGARALVEFLRRHDVELVIATSAGDEEMTALLERAGVSDLIPLRASKDDAAESKPDPDIVHAALRRSQARPETAAMIGDTPYDIEAAARAGVRCIALRCGGYWSDRDLRGADEIFNDPAALLERLRRP